MTQKISRAQLIELFPKWWKEYAQIPERAKIVQAAGYSSQVFVADVTGKRWELIQKGVQQQIIQLLLEEPNCIPLWIRSRADNDD